MSLSTPLGYTTLKLPRRPRGRIFLGFKWLGLCAMWIVLGAAMIGGATWALTFSFGPAFAIATPVAGLLFLAIGATLARGTRRVRDLAVLYYLQQAVAINAPLKGMLMAAGKGESRSIRIRLERVGRRIHAGETVAAALHSATPELPARMTDLVAAGEKAGRLGAALGRVAASERFLPAIKPARAIYLRWYPVILFMFLFATLRVSMIFLMPRYEDLLRSLHVERPRVMIWEGMVSELASDLLNLIFAIGFLLLCGRLVSQLFTSRGVTLGPLRRVRDRLIWHVPIAGGIERNRGLADACYIIAEGLEAGLLLPNALANAEGVAGNQVLRRRVRRWASDVLGGTDLAAAARKAKVPQPIPGMVAETRSAADLIEVFRFLSRYHDGKFSRAATIMRAAIIPLVVIVFGFLVGGLALGLFQPMIEVITRLAH